MADLMQQIAERAAQRAADRESQWAVVVELTAAGTVEPEDVVAVLERTGRTPADLEQAVDQYRRRLALAAEVEAGREAAKRRDAATAELAKLDAAFAEAKQRHERKRAELTDAADRESVIVQAGRDAERELAGLPKPGTTRGGSPGTFLDAIPDPARGPDDDRHRPPLPGRRDARPGRPRGRSRGRSGSVRVPVVRVGFSEDGGGACEQPLAHFDHTDPVQLHIKAVIAAAGPVAESLYGGRTVEECTSPEDAAVIRLVAELLAEKAPGWNPDPFAHARKLLADPGTQAAVVGVARAILDKRGMLTHAEANVALSERCGGAIRDAIDRGRRWQKLV